MKLRELLRELINKLKNYDENFKVERDDVYKKYLKYAWIKYVKYNKNPIPWLIFSYTYFIIISPLLLIFYLLCLIFDKTAARELKNEMKEFMSITKMKIRQKEQWMFEEDRRNFVIEKYRLLCLYEIDENEVWDLAVKNVNKRKRKK